MKKFTEKFFKIKLYFLRFSTENSDEKIFDIWNGLSLVIRILCGLIVGALLGIFVPQATGVAILGDAFVGALKAIAPLLVFFLLIASVSNERQSQKRIIRKVLVLYLLCTFSAALVGVLASKLFPITLTLTVPAAHMAAPEGIAQVLRTLFSNMVANPIHSLANGNYIGILIWGILIGAASEKKLNSKKIAKNASLKTLRFGGAFFCLCKRYSRKRKAPKVVCNFRGRFFLQCFDFVN